MANYSPGPYAPGPGYAQPYQPPDASAVPVTVRRAVWLMYAGAAVSVVTAVLEGAWLRSFMTDMFTSFATAGGQQLPAGFPGEISAMVVVGTVIGGLLTVAVWLWMAWKNRTGRNWARILSTVFFGLSCLSLPNLLTGGSLSTMPSSVTTADGATVHLPSLHMPAGLIAVQIISWLIGLGAVILLWQAASTQFFRARAAMRQFGQPGGGYPAYGQPGYGQPGYAQPGLGGQPGYAEPGYPQPDYGQPQPFRPYGQPPEASPPAGTAPPPGPMPPYLGQPEKPEEPQDD